MPIAFPDAPQWVGYFGLGIAASLAVLAMIFAVFPRRQTANGLGRAAVNLKLHDEYIAEQARQKAIDDAEANRKWRRANKYLGGSMLDALDDVAKDREAEKEAARQRLIRQAKEPDDFSKAVKERATDKIPYVRIPEIALAKGIDLPRYGEMQNRSYDLEGELKDAAANGLLAVWGRPYNGEPRDNDPMLPIPVGHFRKYSFRHGCLEMDMENKHSCTTTIAALTKGKEMTEGESYYDLHVAGTQAREIIDKFGEGLK